MAWVFLAKTILFGISGRIVYRCKRFVTGEGESQYLMKREKARQRFQLGLLAKGEEPMEREPDKALLDRHRREVEEDADDIPGSAGWTLAWCIRMVAGVVILLVIGVVGAVIWAVYSTAK